VAPRLLYKARDNVGSSALCDRTYVSLCPVERAASLLRGDLLARLGSLLRREALPGQDLEIGPESPSRKGLSGRDRRDSGRVSKPSWNRDVDSDHSAAA
jgi:hypothetical protein